MSSRLVFSLSVSALLFSVGNLLSSGLDAQKLNFQNMCITQGWLLQFSEISIFGWITTIALNLYLVVCWNITTNKLEKYYHFAVWTWALLASCVPFVRGVNVYTLSGIWCWISKSYTDLRFILFYVPFLVQVGIVLVLYILIIRRVTANPIEGDYQNKIQLLVTRLRAYPIIFFFLYIFPTINRIHDAVSDNDSFPLYVLQVITAPSIGFVNALAYGDNEIRELWIGLVKNIVHPGVIIEPNPKELSEDEISFSEGNPDTSTKDH